MRQRPGLSPPRTPDTIHLPHTKLGYTKQSAPCDKKCILSRTTQRTWHYIHISICTYFNMSGQRRHYAPTRLLTFRTLVDSVSPPTTVPNDANESGKVNLCMYAYRAGANRSKSVRTDYDVKQVNNIISGSLQTSFEWRSLRNSIRLSNHRDLSEIQLLSLQIFKNYFNDKPCRKNWRDWEGEGKPFTREKHSWTLLNLFISFRNFYLCEK